MNGTRNCGHEFDEQTHNGSEKLSAIFPREAFGVKIENPRKTRKPK